MNTLDMEIALSRYFNPRVNIIVPNVSWGLNIHECDMLIVTRAGYAVEIEIKISKRDLLADLKKTHCHRSDKIKCLYFAIPKSLESFISHIPQYAGIFVVEKDSCKLIRKPITALARKLSPEEHLKVAHLGAMRIWTLKNIIRKGVYDGKMV